MSNNIETEELLKDIFDHTNDMVHVVRMDGTLMYVNQSWSSLLEYNEDEILNHSIYHFIDELDRDRYRYYRDQVINGWIKDVPIIFTMKSRTQKRVIVEGVVSVKLSNGQPLYTRGIFRDVTERINSEERLHSLLEVIKLNEYNFHQILTHAPDAIIVIDQESRIKYWNPKAEEIFGWKSEEVLSNTLTSTIIPEKYREAHQAGMHRYLATGEARVLNKTIEISALKKNGQEFYISLTISQTFQQSGYAFIAFIRDITENKKNQLEIQNKTRQLEQSNRSLEAFAYAASHDLKQPIRKIQLFTERLVNKLNKSLDDADKSYFERIEKSAIRMRHLIEDILDYSSVSFDVDFSQEVDLNQLVKEVTDDLEHEIHQRHAIINIGTLPVVKGSRRQLQQLFQNLIENAIKYSKESVAPEITIVSRVVTGNTPPFLLEGIEANKAYHMIEVQDNGIGFNQQQSENIFNIFTRLHNQEKFEGSGVGLTIALKVVQNHKGFITAESCPGKGSTFKILLP